MLLGEHKTYVYDSIKRKHHILFSNLLYGIYAGCSALYITSEESIYAVKAELSNFGLKSEDAEKLKIVTGRQWYTPDGDFNAKRVVNQYRYLIDEAVDSGFAGLYVSADASDTLDYLTKKGMAKEWMAYESSLGAKLKFPMEAICAYGAEQILSNSQMLLEMVKAHKDTLSLKTEKSILNNQLIRSTVFHQLEVALGKTRTALIFTDLDNHILEQNLSTTDNEKFWDLLEKILKEEDSLMFSHIEQNIINAIFTRIEI